MTPSKENLLPFPLTDMQQAYTVGQSEGLDLGGVSAIVYLEFELPLLDVKRLDRAWRRVISRHEMMRAVFLPDGRQQVLDVTPSPIPVNDLGHRSPSEIEAFLEAVRDRMTLRLLDLEHWPLVELEVTVLPNTHHLHIRMPIPVMDGRSGGILMEDLNAFYGDPELQLAPLPHSFRDCVLSLQDFPDPQKTSESRDYWLREIPSLPLGPDLPLSRNPGTISGHRLVFRRRDIAPSVWAELKKKAIQRGLTLSEFVLACYAEVLSAWSRSPRFSMVFLQTDRLLPFEQINNIVGNFSSTLILDYHREGKNFADRLAAFSKRYTGAALHRHYSGVQVLRSMLRDIGSQTRALVPATAVSSLGGASKQDVPTAPASESTFSPTLVCRRASIPQVLVDHQFHETGDGGLTLHFDIADEVLPPGFGEEFVDAYADLMHRLAESYANWLRPGGLPLPPRQLERRDSVNATDGPIPDGLLHSGFLLQAERSPQALAVVSGDMSMTYDELYRRARALAALLRDQNVTPNSLVAVVMEKGWEQVVAVLGILMSGAAYVPIEPTLPDERRHYSLDNAQVSCAVTQPRWDGTLSWPSGVHRLVVSADPPGDSASVPSVQGAEDLAYVIYTSGSTGNPKGVMIDHRGALNTVVDVNRRFEVGPGDSVFAISSLSFDLSVYDIFGTLAAGATLVMPDVQHQKDPAHWHDLIRRHHVTLWNSTPTLLQLLVDHLEEVEGRFPDSLRVAMLSGDWIPVSLPDRFRALADVEQLCSLGGATEASIWSIWFPVEKVDPAWRSIPYGVPMTNQSFRVLNEKMLPCPDWVPGDLYIGGVGLAKGYWKDQEKTDASFVECPWTKERIYRTGDLGRYLPDGNIEFLGREDAQVKVRGYRIELGEIETALSQHPAVREVVVIVRQRGQGPGRSQRWDDPGGPARVEATDQAIVAYWVPRPSGPESGDLRAFLGGKLPDYMVPSHIIQIDRIPLTRNGKVDRRALPTPDQTAVSGDGASDQPGDDVERQLAAIWAEVLGLESVGVADNFFDLGGHSALAVRVVALIRRRMDRTIPVSTMFRGTTVHELAKLLRQREPIETSCLVAIGEGGTRPPFYCVHPVSGSVLCYAELARQLGAERSFYGLQSSGLAGDRATQTSIEEMASHYVALVQKQRPQGPYCLGGWSMGGLIALEMAGQLRLAGHDVSKVAIIDAHLDEAGTDRLSPARRTAFYIEWFLRDIAGILGRDDAPPDGLEGLDPDRQLTLALEHVRRLADPSPFSDLNELRHYFEVFVANAEALERHKVRPYGGSVAVFRASDSVGSVADWDRIVDGVQDHELHGNHYSIMSAGIGELAGGLRSYLDEE